MVTLIQQLYHNVPSSGKYMVSAIQSILIGSEIQLILHFCTLKSCSGTWPSYLTDLLRLISLNLLEQ